MNNYGFTGRILSRKLKADTIRYGGLETIITPTLLCHIGNELERVSCVAFGGFPSLVHYNKDRENKNKIDKFNKKMRSLRRNIRNKGLRQRGLTHIISTGVAGGDTQP